ncbi:MAG: PDZ domain-containing protein [Cellvibrionaceae bacterium]
MVKIAGLVLAGLITGYAIATFIEIAPASNGSVANSSTASRSDTDLSVRLTELERRLDGEINQRQELEIMLDQLLDDESRMPPFAVGEAIADVRPGLGNAGGATDEAQQRREELRERMQYRNSDEGRAQRLQESGFPASQAAWIVEREKEIRLNSLYEGWHDRRQALLDNPSRFDPVGDNPLRAELGEQAYERYLEANGRSTSVRVSSLIDGSPAAAAGFQPGDEIVGYNGGRVFDLSELNASTVQGELGEPVIVDVVRDGTRIQLAIERGPLGIVSRRGRRR